MTKTNKPIDLKTWAPKVGDKVMTNYGFAIFVASGGGSTFIVNYTKHGENGGAIVLKKRTKPVGKWITFEATETSVCPVQGDIMIELDHIEIRFERIVRAGDIDWSDKNIKSYMICDDQCANIDETSDVIDMKQEYKKYAEEMRFVSEERKKLCEELLAENKKLKAELLSLKPDPFKSPYDVGKKYFLVNCEGTITETTWYGEEVDNDISAQGSASPTHQGAEAIVERRATDHKIRTLCNDVGFFDFLCGINNALNNTGLFNDKHVNAINIIGEEQLRKFLEG